MTVKEIKEKLDELGVEYNDKMRKAELIELLNPKKHVVVYDFKDLQDNGFIYVEGDTFPREENKHVSQERIDELLSKQNKIGKQLIREQD